MLHPALRRQGRCIGVEPPKDDGEPFECKMKLPVAELRKQQAEGHRLDTAIAENWQRWGSEVAMKPGGIS